MLLLRNTSSSSSSSLPSSSSSFSSSSSSLIPSSVLPIILFIIIILAVLPSSLCQSLPAVRVVRFRVDYPDAELDNVHKLPNWSAIMRKSLLASLRFVNKHWLICGEVQEEHSGGDRSNSGTDCGKLQVTGEEVEGRHYRINATFIANRDPVRNAKVDANSSVQAVIQIGLKGGIFQYTNAMKVLGKPGSEMAFEEALFCYPGQELVPGTDQCRTKEQTEQTEERDEEAAARKRRMRKKRATA